jgi:multisubunit Na+/H+ antiporter MnhC subunit
VLVIAVVATPDPGRVAYPGLTRPAVLHDLLFILYRNGLVLALHALACVAGFIAGSSLPAAAQSYTGVWRKVHERAGPLAIAFVLGATLFSLATQAYALGHVAADLAWRLDVSPLLLLAGLLPHALPELTALFLPLAAWTFAARRDAWQDLLAATFVTVAIAVPILVVAAAVETWVAPELLLSLRP